jgi:hypothetical protein
LGTSPAFDDARRRRQVVEHRIARLVQLGIRQARYFGRTRTLFQVCLAAAVANLTLLAATSNVWTDGVLAAGDWLKTGLAPLLALSTLLLGFGLTFRRSPLRSPRPTYASQSHNHPISNTPLSAGLQDGLVQGRGEVCSRRAVCMAWRSKWPMRP